jgi:hypothetical protein
LAGKRICELNFGKRDDSVLPMLRACCANHASWREGFKQK